MTTKAGFPTFVEFEAAFEAARLITPEQAKAQLEAELAEFEREGGMPSAEMRAKVVSGELPETYFRCQWLMAHTRYLVFMQELDAQAPTVV